MKSKRSRKDKARRKSLSKKSLPSGFLNSMIADIFSMYDKVEAEKKKFFDECPAIGMFKVRKSFNQHESVGL